MGIKKRFADGSGRSFTIDLDFLARRVLSDADEISEDDAPGFRETKLTDEGVQEVVNGASASAEDMSDEGANEGIPLIEEFLGLIAPLQLNLEEKAALWRNFVVSKKQFERIFDSYVRMRNGHNGAKKNGNSHVRECYSMEKYGMPCFSGSPCVRVTLRGRGTAKLLRSLDPLIES